MGGALCTLFRNKTVKILYYGLDDAGKTTLVYRLTLGEVITTIPTIGFNVETVTHNGLDLMQWDIGLRDKGRSLFRHYTQNTDGIMFVVDSTDRDRLAEAVSEFAQIVLEIAEVHRLPVLVVANKQDLDGAMTPEEIREEINKQCKITTDWEVFPASALTFEGVTPAMDWLTNQLASRLVQESYGSFLGSKVDKVARMPASLVKGVYSSFYSYFLSGFGSLPKDNQITT